MVYGYPVVFDYSEKLILWELLLVEKNAGIKFIENFVMFLVLLVSGFYFGHSEARYFGVGKIAKDQVKDYAHRKSISLDLAERYLGPVLGYL